MTKETVDGLLVLSAKETLLSNIVVWLKAKGLWEDCKKDVGLGDDLYIPDTPQSPLTYIGKMPTV